MPGPALRPVTFCGQNLRNASHVCAFFESDKQEIECVVPFLAEGLANGEQVFTIPNDPVKDRYMEALRQHAPDAAELAIRNGQFQVKSVEESYLEGDRFDVDRMCGMLEQLLKEAEEGPYKRLRTCGGMSWTLRGMPGTDDFMEYESRVNQLIWGHDCTMLCVYEVNKFSGRAVMDVLATHPYVVMGSRLYENPYYVDPRTFLQTLLRRAAPLARSPA